MNALFDLWYGMSRRGRVFGWCAGVLCLTLTVALSVGYPGWKTFGYATNAVKPAARGRPATVASSAPSERRG
ncbi:membrane protein [Salmonella enterica subsp. enterica]|nr:membrane protein [Salmonella enterica subsp. enterica]